MASTISTVTGKRANVSTTAFTLRETSDDKQVTSLNPLAVGLILEAGILAVPLGNLLVLLSLKFQKHWLITDILLLSLSVADFVGGAFALQIVIFMNYFLQLKWTEFNCGLYIVVGHSLRFASAGTVTLMAIDRAFMILKPLKYHTTVTTSRVKKLVVFTWVCAIFFASLPFMGVGKSGYEDGKCFYHLTDLGNTYAILMLSVSFLLLTSVLVCYFAIKSSSAKFIERQERMNIKNKSAGTDPTRRSASEVPYECGRPKERRKSSLSGVREIQRLSRMMAVVVFLYYISWLPMLVSLSLQIVGIVKANLIIVKICQARHEHGTSRTDISLDVYTLEN